MANKHSDGKDAEDPASTKNNVADEAKTPTQAGDIGSTVKTEGKFETEFKILTFGALRRIAERMAEVVAEQAGHRPIVVAARPLASDLGLYDAFSAQIDILSSRLDSPATVAAEQAESLALPTPGDLTAILDGASKIFSYFKVQTETRSVETVIDDATLNNAVTGALLRRGLTVRLPDVRAFRASAGSPTLLERLVRLSGKLANAAPPPDDKGRSEREEIATRIKALRDALLDQNAVLLQRLSALEWIRLAADDGALLLSASISAAGGSLHVRTSLWTNLFSGADLKFSGGAALNFMLSDLGSGEIYASDVLYVYISPAKIGEDPLAPASNLDAAFPRATPRSPGVSTSAGAAAEAAQASAAPWRTYNPKYRVFFEALTEGGFYSADPDDLSTKRSIRTNNPGALNVTAWQREFPGFVGLTQPDGSGNRTSIYRTPEHGVAAWYTLLTVRYGYGSTGRLRIGDLARRYAGVPSEGSSAARGYVSGWRRFSGDILSADSVVRLDNIEDVVQLGKAMFDHEIGKTTPVKDDQVGSAVRAWRDGTLPAK